MKKNLYYQFSDGEDYNAVIMELSGCMEWIENDMNEEDEGADRVFTIKPIWMTSKEYKNLPER